LKAALDEIKQIIEGEVIKREILDGERALSAQRQVKRAARKMRKLKEIAAGEKEHTDTPNANEVVTA
jgi:hypothetical protein